MTVNRGQSNGVGADLVRMQPATPNRVVRAQCATSAAKRPGSEFNRPVETKPLLPRLEPGRRHGAGGTRATTDLSADGILAPGMVFTAGSRRAAPRSCMIPQRDEPYRTHNYRTPELPRAICARDPARGAARRRCLRPRAAAAQRRADLARHPAGRSLGRVRLRSRHHAQPRSFGGHRGGVPQPLRAGAQHRALAHFDPHRPVSVGGRRVGPRRGARSRRPGDPGALQAGGLRHRRLRAAPGRELPAWVRRLHRPLARGLVAPARRGYLRVRPRVGRAAPRAAVLPVPAHLRGAPALRPAGGVRRPLRGRVRRPADHHHPP